MINNVIVFNCIHVQPGFSEAESVFVGVNMRTKCKTTIFAINLYTFGIPGEFNIRILLIIRIIAYREDKAKCNLPFQCAYIILFITEFQISVRGHPECFIIIIYI